MCYDEDKNIIKEVIIMEPIYIPKTGKNAGQRNRERIRMELLKNPDITCIEIAEKLKMSRQSVGRHLKSFMPKKES